MKRVSKLIKFPADLVAKIEKYQKRKLYHKLFGCCL
jgi:hypothetical protein